MKIKCDYCKTYINDYDEKCPNCGAPNEHLVRKAIDSPKTIEELKEWYKQKNLPPEETTRFFIGTDYKKPRAFGIYKDEETGNFVVYKNKDNGQRAIRYEGKDEAYAVNELYLRLKEEIVNQKSRNLNRKQGSKNIGSLFRSLRTLVNLLALFIFVIFIGVMIFFVTFGRGHYRGYYNYNDKYYYYQDGEWYIYNSGWKRALDVPNELDDNSKNYYSSYSYDSDYDTSDFSDTYYYHEPSSSSSDDWDSGSSWDSSDSWDSGGTDWDSDW